MLALSLEERRPSKTLGPLPLESEYRIEATDHKELTFSAGSLWLKGEMFKPEEELALHEEISYSSDTLA